MYIAVKSAFSVHCIPEIFESPGGRVSEKEFIQRQIHGLHKLRDDELADQGKKRSEQCLVIPVNLPWGSLQARKCRHDRWEVSGS